MRGSMSALALSLGVFRELTSATRARLEKHARPRALAVGDALFDVGDEVTVTALVVEGVMREVYVDSNGEERTRGFSFEGDFAGAWSDVLADRPSRTRVEALTKVRVQLYPLSALRALEATAPDLQRALRLVAEQLYLKKSDREFELLTMDAAERYAALVKSMPDLERRVQLRHIASYLGIIPVHLSRLRRRRGTS